MIIFIPFILIIGHAHLIISVTQSNSVVNSNQLLSVKILTTSAITSNALSVVLPSDFSMVAQCKVDNATVGCSTSSSSTLVTAVFSSSFASGVNYILTLNVTNPSYATSFLLNAAVSSSAFGNTATLAITAKTITCSLTPSSNIVGDTTIGSFAIGNDALPTGSSITISSATQTTFPNLFSSNPTCQSGNISLTCTQSISLSQQFLTISNSPTTANLVITVNSINNPPYNSSFLDIALQIQNKNSFKMQICSFKQQAVTTLRSSTALTVSNWNTSVGATSTVTLTLSTYFTPYTTTLLWVYDNTLTAVVFAPASSTIIQFNSTSSNTISSTTAIGRSLSFSAQITNPPSKQPLTSYLYVVYSGSFFVQQYTVSNMVLTSLSLSASVQISDSRTSITTAYKATVGIPYTLTSPVIILDLAFGSYQCSNLSLVSSSTLNLISCSANKLVVNSSSIPAGSLWLSFNVRNHLSIRSNSISISVTGPAPFFYQVGNGSTTVQLIANNQTISISSSNSTFAAPTTFDLLQAYLGYDNTVIRTATIQLPIDIQMTSTTIVSAYNSSCVITSFSINLALSQISVTLSGPFLIHLSGLSNPVKYNQSLAWTVATSDNSGFSSSLSNIAGTLYTPTVPSLSVSLVSNIIEQQTTLTLTIVPALQYYSPPKLTITLSNSLIVSACANCTILSSLSVSLPYSSAVMRIDLRVINSQHPVNNSLTLSIAAGSLSYQIGTLSYALASMAFTYLAVQSGLFGTIGSLNITILSGPTQPVTLTYEDVSTMLSGPVCVTCSNSQIYLTGIIRYFQIYYLRVNGIMNGVVYATSLVPVYYVCQSIQGCRICSNVTNNGTTTLTCQQCFNSSLTNFSLLYQNKCLQSCPISTYSNSLTCVNCPALCYICDVYRCQQCVPNYYLYNGSCISPCPAGFISNATSCITVPIICPQHCVNCPADNQCSACDSGWVLFGNSCYSSCPTGYDLKGSTCVLFVPPEQAQYFPFAFLISACLIFISLAVIKCFEKRSLVMGNLIAFLSFVETGSLIMTLIYTFKESNDLLTQALCFVLLLSKVLMNLVFLAYFLRVIVPDEHFSTWRENDESNQTLFKVLITLSSIFSFQSIRILYSRLLGLRLFFGKFNTALIFKPLNYFTIGYFVTCALALVILSIRNIVAQNGYRTSTFFTSVQSIIIELLMAISCIVDNKKGYDDEFFEYQIYKVNNEYESSRIQPIQIQQQGENAGSMHEILNAVNSRNDRRKNLTQIVKNPMWVKKLPREESLKDEPLQSECKEGESQVSLLEVADKVGSEKADEITEKNYLSAESKKGDVKLDANGKPINEKDLEKGKQFQLSVDQGDNKANIKFDERGGMIENKRENLFRKKIIEDWRQIQKTLPNKMNQLRWEMQNKSKKRSRKLGKSQSPDTKMTQSVKKQLRRVASVEKVEVRLPELPGSIPDRIKQYFHSFSPFAKQDIVQRRLNQHNIPRQNLKQKAEEKQVEKQQENPQIMPKSMTLEAEIALSEIQSSSNGILQTEQRNPFDQEEQEAKGIDGEYWEKMQQNNNENNGLEQAGEEADAQTESADKRNTNKGNFIDEEENISNEDANDNDEYDENEADLQFRGHESNQRFFNANHNVHGNHNNSHGRYQLEEHANNMQLEAIAEADIELFESKRKPPKLPGFRHEGQEKEKKYRTKKRRVNRQTEEVYLQRLVGSSQRKMRSRGRKLEF